MNSALQQTVAVVLAAGKGVRMKSKMPKVLHPLLGKPMLSYILETCRKIKVDRIIVVIGNGADLVRETLGSDYEYVEQSQQLGTGHALMMTAETLKGFVGDLLVLAGDTPFLTDQILRRLIRKHKKTNAAATLMTTIIDPPPAYGRIIRDESDRVLRIVEERDAFPEEKKITEVNTSHYCFQAEKVFHLLSSLDTNNAQGEYYLTDVIQLFVQEEKRVETLVSNDPKILVGINSRLELNKASAMLKDEIICKLMNNGVTILDPLSVYIEPDVKIGQDTIIHPFTSLLGRTTIGEGCIIGPQVKLLDVRVGDNCHIEFSVIECRKIKNGDIVGPFAYISGSQGGAA